MHLYLRGTVGLESINHSLSAERWIAPVPVATRSQNPWFPRFCFWFSENILQVTHLGWGGSFSYCTIQAYRLTARNILYNNEERNAKTGYWAYFCNSSFQVYTNKLSSFIHSLSERCCSRDNLIRLFGILPKIHRWKILQKF